MFTSPIWDTVGAAAAPSHPMAKLPSLPSSLPASQTSPHGPSHGADVQGLSPKQGKVWDAPFGCAQPPRCGPAQAAGIWAEQVWGWAQPRHDPQGQSGHAHFSRSRSLPLAPWAHFSSSTCSAWFPQLHFPGSFPWAQFPVLTSVSSPAPPEWRFLGHGSLDTGLQARFSRHTSPEVSPGLGASRGSPHQPGASRGPPLPAQHRLEIIKHIIYLAKLCARIRKRAGIRSPPGDRRQRVPPGFCFQCQHSAALKPWERSSLKWQLWSQAINLTS